MLGGTLLVEKTLLPTPSIVGGTSSKTRISMILLRTQSGRGSFRIGLSQSSTVSRVSQDDRMVAGRNGAPGGGRALRWSFAVARAHADAQDQRGCEERAEDSFSRRSASEQGNRGHHRG